MQLELAWRAGRTRAEYLDSVGAIELRESYAKLRLEQKERDELMKSMSGR